MADLKLKDYSDGYIYNLRRSEYDRGIVDFINHAHRIDKNAQQIQDMLAVLKLQNTSSYFSRVFKSDNTVLCIGERALPRAFKVFVAKDPKNGGKRKLFVDCTGIVDRSSTGGEYSFANRDLPMLVALIIAGAHDMIYYNLPEKVLNKNSILDSATSSFSKLVFYIADYLRLTSDLKAQGLIKYYASKYFQLVCMGKDLSESVENRAMKIGGISEREVMMLNDITFADIKPEDRYKDFTSLIAAIKSITRSSQLTKEAFLDKWMHAIGNGSQFTLELYPAFANMMVHAYIGDGVVMQKTIEKVVGREMVEYFSAIDQLGGEVL